MKKKLLHIVLGVALACGIISSCGKDDTKVIPRGKLARIYAEMLVTDQWITSTPGIRKIADTSLVYEPILEKYGYDSDDYRKSIDVYMDDPERFARILRTTGEILDQQIKELEKEQVLLDMKDKLPKLDYDIRWRDFFPYLHDEPYVHYYDSISFEPDSVMWIYRLKPIEKADTIYDRLRMIILSSQVEKDSLALRDSIALADSLVVADSLALRDSIIAKSLPARNLKPKVDREISKNLIREFKNKLPISNAQENISDE